MTRRVGGAVGRSPGHRVRASGPERSANAGDLSVADLNIRGITSAATEPFAPWPGCSSLRRRGVVMTTALSLDQVKTRQRETWSSGDYGKIAWLTVPLADSLCEAVGVRPGAAVLDVAT